MSLNHEINPNNLQLINAYTNSLLTNNIDCVNITGTNAYFTSLTFQTATGTVLIDERVDELTVINTYTGAKDNFLNNAVITSLTGTTANISTLNSTDNFLTNANITSLTGTSAFFLGANSFVKTQSLNFGSATGLNLGVTNNLTANNFSATNVTGTNYFISSLTGSDIKTTNFSFTNETGTTATITNIFSSNVSSTSFTGTSYYLPSAKYSSVLASFNAFQVQGMYTGAVQILPAPGAGFAYYIDSMMANVFNSTGYTNGGNFCIGYGMTGKAGQTPATNNVNSITASLLTNQGNASAFVVGINNSVGNTSNNFVNQPISISNGSAPFQGGTGSTLNIILDYRTIPMQ